MGEAPSALLIGDVDLDRVERLLEQLGVDFERLREPRPQLDVPAPRRLLVVSGRCLLKLPTLSSKEPTCGDPVRVCIHNQDFLPLRGRLREQGFHYLIQASLDETSLRVFFSQLLHSRPDQRSRTRLPLGGRVDYRSGQVSGSGRLADLSADGCRIVGAEGLTLDEPVTVSLPAVLGGGAPLALPGKVLRCADEPIAGEVAASAVIRFRVLEADIRERLDRLVQGEVVGARVTPLTEPPPAPAAIEPERVPPAPAAANAAPSAERRQEVRHPYRGRADVLELPGDADGALCRDLSLDGVCITGLHHLKPGMRVTLALFGEQTGKPTIVGAEVIRVGSDESALVFRALTDVQQVRLGSLIAQQPAMEAIAAGSDEDSRLIATKILERGE